MEGNGYRSGISKIILLRKVGGRGPFYHTFFLTFSNCPYYNLQRIIEAILLRHLDGSYKCCIGWSCTEPKYFAALSLECGLSVPCFWLFDWLFKDHQLLVTPGVRYGEDFDYYVQYIKDNSLPRSFLFYDRDVGF